MKMLPVSKQLFVIVVIVLLSARWLPPLRINKVKVKVKVMPGI